MRKTRYISGQEIVKVPAHAEPTRKSHRVIATTTVQSRRMSPSSPSGRTNARAVTQVEAIVEETFRQGRCEKN
jgi:hypothetical protein